MRHFKIYYKDGVYAETITYMDKTDDFIEENLKGVIDEYNKNPNSLYRISRENITEVK
jgi:hypothetical protein